MEAAAAGDDKKNFYSVWAVPPDDVKDRLNKLMDGLRSEYRGTAAQPHVTVMGATSLTEQDAVSKFRSACDGVKAYTAAVDCVSPKTHCLYLLLRPTPEVVDVSSRCSGYFGYHRSTAYMPHMSLAYGDLTDEEKKKAARDKAIELDDNIENLSFEMTRLELWKTDPADQSRKSWEKISECNLSPIN